MLLSVIPLDHEFALGVLVSLRWYLCVVGLFCLKVFLSFEIELCGGHGFFASVAFAESAFVCSWPGCWCFSVAGVVADAARP